MGLVVSLSAPASAQGLPADFDEAALEAWIPARLPIDMPSLVPPGTLVIDGFCYADTIFGCIGRVDAFIHNSPPLTLSGFAVDVVPLAESIEPDIALDGVAIRVRVVAVLGIGFTCFVDVFLQTPPAMMINANFSLSEVGGPHRLYATQLGPVNFSFGSFDDCGGFLGDVIEFFLGVLSPTLEDDFLRLPLEFYFNSIDGNGNTPIAAAIEAASAPLIELATVGGSGNACDPQPQGCFGSVAETFRISQLEVTNAQYATFLNSVAATDTNALYNTNMGVIPFGGITRFGSYGYSIIAGRQDLPVNYVSFWDTTRFANWLHNGKAIGAQDNTTTEDGVYTLTGTTISNNSVTRNIEAEFFLASENEWYEAAYYDTDAMSYSDYPASSDAQISCTAPGATPNTANCQFINSDATIVGNYTGAASPNGTFDQGGNQLEWIEVSIGGTSRGLRGGSHGDNPEFLEASYRSDLSPATEGDVLGFRIASPALPPA